MGISILTLLNRVVDVQQRGNTTMPGTGGSQPSWTTIAAAVPCRIVPLSVREVLEMQRLGSEATVKLYFAQSVPTGNTTRYAYADPATGTTRYFRSQGQMNPDEAGAYWIVLAEAVVA